MSTQQSRSWYVMLAVLVFSTALFAETEWINKDFKNSTGHTRNDLHWAIAGHIENAIVDTSSPSELPNVEIEETGPAPVTWVKWSGGDVTNGTTVHCGIKVEWDDIPGQRFNHGAYWTLDGSLMEKVSGCASANVSFGEVIEVDVSNTKDPEDPPLDVSDFSYAFVDDPCALADLTWNNPAIPWLSLPWSDTIPPNGSQYMGQIPMTEPGRYLILQFAVNFSSDPPENAGHIIVQRQVQAPESIPTVSEWGLIVMTLLLLTAGTVVIRRRQAMTA